MWGWCLWLKAGSCFCLLRHPGLDPWSRFPRRLAEPRIKSGVTTRGEGRLLVLCANPDTQPLLAPARPARVRERHIMTLILGLESSCDETAAALVDSERRVRAHRVAGQEAEHRPYGGVVPEIAARAHVDRLAPLVEGVLADAGVPLAAEIGRAHG